MSLRFVHKFGFATLYAGVILGAILPAQVHAQSLAPTLSQTLIPALASHRIAVADIHTGNTGNEIGVVVRRTVRSMIDYSRFPHGKSPKTLCILGRSKFGSHLDNVGLANGNHISSRAVSRNSLNFTGCDILYLGQLDKQKMRAATTAVRNKAVLTIAENDPDCRSRSMFCLIFSRNTMTFRMNIDAISRSKVRVDPRILRLAKDTVS